VLRAAADHPGTALVEIYQNCNIFNDGAFEALKDKEQAQEAVIRLEHGQPIRFGAPFGAERGGDGLGSKGVVRDQATGDLKVIDVTVEGTDAVLVHDAHTASPTTAFALSRLADADTLH
ncbi:2-oxoacid:ferredoxin oxidoreductase subunit beta, partial [Streptomyces chitinivorans]|nr:2-oxoacid:ferredoxin oxidoreductase subunit beta [Streptomyces chitinivorans]